MLYKNKSKCNNEILNYFEPTKINLRAGDYNVNFINFLLTGTLIKISLFKKRL